MDIVEVVTPCYNAEKYIGECIESVRNSVTLGKFKIEQVVVEDGSDDNSANVLKNIKQDNLKIILNKANSGQSAARNTGIKALAKADYLFFLDADDMLFQNSLRYLWDAAKTNKSDWVYGDFLKSDEKGRYLPGDDYYGWNFKDEKEILAAIFEGKHYFQQNSFFKADIIRAAEGFDENMKMAEDLDLAVRLIIKGNLPTFLPGPLYIHRFHKGNLSTGFTKNPGQHLKSLEQLHWKYEKDLAKYNL
jgi:glycosyltransferase involved in cell wall biosynthesis